MQNNTITLLGPCYKLNSNSGELYPAFSVDSRSGKFIRKCLEGNIHSEAIIEYDNIIETAFFNSKGHECIPKSSDLVEALLTHSLWQTSSAVIAFGKAVHEAFESLNEYDKRRNIARNVVIYFMPHPSYILRRPVTERDEFSRVLLRSINDSVSAKVSV